MNAFLIALRQTCRARFQQLTLTALIALVPATSMAQTCGVPGKDGVATPAGVVNAYHAGSGTAAALGNQVTVASTTGQRTSNRALRAGDLVLIVQMQDGTTPANAGLHEYATVTSIAGNVLTLNRTLTNTYVQNIAANLVRTFQVVYVPQYASAALSGTVNADRWTISAAGAGTGGIVAMDVAGSLALTGTIDVSGAGFRGGAAINSANSRAGGAFGDLNYVYNPAAGNGGVKGEGTAGTPIVVFDGTAALVNYSALLTQGYAAGSGGIAAQGNAGGGANDGEPNAGNNQYNAGGGGGSNGGAGGQGGRSWSFQNDAGGRGAAALVSSIGRLVLGGGGGAGGTNNNGNANAVTTWPPIDDATTRALPPAQGTTNGADGGISVSGAPGGGMVLVRAGTLTGGGSINANGYTAYNTNGGSEGAGGAGAGGSVVVLAGNSTSGALTINANGGKGGYSNYFDHGPGGGGGGGAVITNFATATINRIGGLSGQDGCCAGGQGNGSPKPDFSAPGVIGTSSTAGGIPTGVLGGASCLPVLQVTKTTLQSTVTAATGATTSYSINVSNSRGAATNVFLFDANLPPGWAYTSTPATTYSYSPAPPGAGSAGAETTSATLPAGLPVNTALTANSVTAVSLRANGAAPGLVPTTGNNSPTFGSFYLPQNGSITITYVVTIPDTATAGVYHNPAGVIYLDPTRTAAAGIRMVSPALDVSSNRAGISYSSNVTYVSGSTTAVAGSNYSGLAAGPANDNVVLLPDLSVTKTISTSTFTVGVTGQQYTIVGRNNGRPVADQIYANTQATGQSATSIVSPALSITDTLPTGMTLTTATTSNNTIWTCTPNAVSTTFTCAATAAVYPLPAATNIVTITATVTVSTLACPGPRFNTVTIATPAIGDAVLANNTATVATPVGCSADMRVTKTNEVTSVNAGSTTNYTVTFSNLGPAAADGATATDTRSAGLSCTVTACSSSGTGVCPAALQWPNLLTGGLVLSPFASGATVNFVVSCGVTATGLP